MKTSVSILTALHNKAEYVPTTLDSIKHQVLDADKYELEWIIVDDASTDESVRVIETYDWQTSPTKLVLERNTENLGAAKTYNKALSLAKGDYVLVLDADDMVIGQGIQRRLDYAVKYKLDWVVGNLLKTNYAGKLLPGKEFNYYAYQNIPIELFRQQVVSGKTMVLLLAGIISRQAVEEVGGWPDYMVGSQDYGLFLRLLLGGFQPKYIDQFVGAYRGPSKTSEDSLYIRSIKSGQMIKDMQALFAEVNPRLTDTERALFPQIIARYEQKFAEYAKATV